MWWLAALVVCVLALWLHNRHENPLDVLPCPPAVPVLGHMLMLVKISPNNLFSMMRQFTEQCGDRYIFKVFRRRVLHLSRPGDIEIVLSHSRNISKSLPYKFVQSWLGTGLILNTGASWHQRRKALTPTFHFNILRNFALVMEEKSRDLVKRLGESRRAVDVLPLISDMTLFTICETAMGTQLDADKSDTTMQYRNAIHNLGYIVIDRLTKIYLHIDFIFKLTENGKKFDKYLHTVFSFCDKVILEKKRKRTEDKISPMLIEDVGTKKRLAMLDLLLEAESRGQIDLTGIRDEVNNFMFAGHDTTAMALTFCLMLLADHEEVQQRVYEEILQILGTRDRSPTIAELADMKFLDAVIKETLRLYPSVPFIGRHTTEEFMLDDLLVGKDTEISVHIYELHHRADLFPEPDLFRPDRFMTGEVRHPYAYIPFSAGLRNCIGQRFAMLEMKFVMSAICRQFRLTPLQRGWRPALKTDFMLRPTDPVYVQFNNRQ